MLAALLTVTAPPRASLISAGHSELLDPRGVDLGVGLLLALAVRHVPSPVGERVALVLVVISRRQLVAEFGQPLRVARAQLGDDPVAPSDARPSVLVGVL